ncbi:uncharacterized protein YeaO (DUF488 family) [Thermosporothrix hazakensis]|jgi:uncharacterized protein YeaO (DUF488 family)|uniref:Uncharacterized protein YeaO (DUF488 family) n=1 Tax=Thermosporothrix hazakensis TaxID=644383 RepID=A0A326UI27_THEHA|nr:DUF488 domain-containing protein [Thermosporothrix hazakensis]PZW36490.1 uncharacterized protein YeaO (DUF488 family) [Thermosporothrix hazakensis]GCE47144.1 hypothetical protein KTH_20130 [Thermosporothrix hazakensis]
MYPIRLKRAYEAPDESDGTRVLVERLWPRGVSKAKAHIDLWLKDIAPSTDLRHWYGHEPEKFPEFRQRYEAELHEGAAHDALNRLREMIQQQPVTLVYATKDAEHSSAAVLYDILQQQQ